MRRQQIQLAFNHTVDDFVSIIPHIPRDKRIVIEAGTPLIKQAGIGVVSLIRSHWAGDICADLKIADGANQEVLMAHQAGATSVTALGTSSQETLKIFVDTCKQCGIRSVIDMINVSQPMKQLFHSRVIPDVVLLHRGRDEENSFGKIIAYKEIAKISGKWDLTMGIAGGVDKREMQSAIFNNADLVVVNLIKSTDIWKGIHFDQSFSTQLQQFLAHIR